MTSETICKVSIHDTIYKVNAIMDKEKGTHGFRVLKGRNIAKGGNFFYREQSAVMFMLRLAFGDVAQLSIEGVL